MSIDPRDERAEQRKRAQEDRLASAFAGFLCAAGMLTLIYVAAQVSVVGAVILGVIFAVCSFGTYRARQDLRKGRDADLDLLRDAAELLGPIGGRDAAPSKPKPPVLRADESEF